MTDRVIIVGGGLGGLATAIRLQQHKIPFLLFERDEQQFTRPQGYAIGIQNNGIKSLHELGVDVQEIKSKSRPLTIFDFRDGSGGLLMRLDATKNQDLDLFSVNRSLLREKMLEQIDSERVVYNSKFVKYELTSNGVKAHFDNGKVVLGKILVGADGSRSSVRQQLLADGRHYLGVAQIGANIDAINTNTGKPFFEQDLTLMTLSREGVSFFMFPQATEDSNTKRIFWSLIYKTDEESASKLKSAEQTELAEKCEILAKKLHAPILEVVKASKNFRATIYYDSDVDKLNTLIGKNNSVVVIGDAAHSMSPFRGQGGNSALEDGVKLGDMIANGNNIDDFVKEMYKRTKPHVMTSRYSVYMFVTDNWWFGFIRDWCMKACNILMRILSRK
jgi:salicylate hydroxylase